MIISYRKLKRCFKLNQDKIWAFHILYTINKIFHYEKSRKNKCSFFLFTSSQSSANDRIFVVQKWRLSMKTENDWRLPFNYHISPFQKLLKMSQQQSRSAYKQAQLNLIDYLDRKVFSVHLIDPSRVTAHEIFCYSDGNQAKHHIRGSLRAAIHTGLSDPQIYLDVS